MDPMVPKFVCVADKLVDDCFHVWAVLAHEYD